MIMVSLLQRLPPVSIHGRIQDFEEMGVGNSSLGAFH